MGQAVLRVVVHTTLLIVHVVRRVMAVMVLQQLTVLIVNNDTIRVTASDDVCAHGHGRVEGCIRRIGRHDGQGV